MRQGNLGFLCTQQPGDSFSASGICNNTKYQLYSPYNGAPYASNVVTGINSAATAFLGFYPLPNVGSAFTSDNYRTNVPANLDSNGFDVRGDQYFGQKLFVTGRYTYKNVPELSPEQLTIPSSTQFEHVRMLVASGTYTFRPTLLNEFRFGLTDDLTGTTNPYNGKPFTNSLGFANINDLWYNGLPEIDFNGSSGTQGLTVDRLNSNGQSRTYEFADNLSWVKGRHSFKFGMDAQKLRAVSALGFQGADNYGTYGFNGMFTGYDFSDFLIGAPATSFLDNVQLDNDGRNYILGFFAQDSYKVSKRLTLELGVRFDYHPGYSDASGQIGNFIQTPLSGGAVYPNGAASLLEPRSSSLSTPARMRPSPASQTTPLPLTAHPAPRLRPHPRRAFPRGFAPPPNAHCRALALPTSSPTTIRPCCAAASALTRRQPWVLSTTRSPEPFRRIRTNTITLKRRAWDQPSLGPPLPSVTRESRRTDPRTSARPTRSPGKSPIPSSGTFPWSATSGEERGCASPTSA